MVQSTKFDALSATTTFMSLEKWVSNNIGDELGEYRVRPRMPAAEQYFCNRQ